MKSGLHIKYRPWWSRGGEPKSGHMHAPLSTLTVCAYRGINFYACASVGPGLKKRILQSSIEPAFRIVLHSQLENLNNMSVVAAPPASEEPKLIPPPRKKMVNSPIPPPRRKRASSSPKHHHIEEETSISSSCNNKNSGEHSPPTKPSPPSDLDPRKKETSIAVKLPREEWIKSGSNSLPRIENYYTRTGPEMRRKTSAPPSANTTSSCAATTNAVEKSATPSPTHAVAPAVEKESPTRSKRSPTGSTPKGTTPISPSRPKRPPIPPPPYNSTKNKTAPYSQLYTCSATDMSTVVIDSKAVRAGDERSLSAAPRNYGKMRGSRTSGHGSNRDDASIVYGKKTQAALNKLVATLKRFQGSGSSSQKTSPVRKSNVSNTPPERPPPAMRNTPPMLRTVPSNTNTDDSSNESACATYSIDSTNEENPCVNLYDDHIYMEVGKVAFKSDINEGGGSGMEKEDDEDDYVIMNLGENSHVYTPLTFDMRSESTAG